MAAKEKTTSRLNRQRSDAHPGCTSQDQIDARVSRMAGAAKNWKIEKLGPGAPSHRLPWTAGLSSRASPGQSGRGGKGDPAGGWGARVHNVQKKLRKTAPGNASNVKGITNQETYYEPCAAENPGTSKHRKGRGRGGSPEPREDPTHKGASETPPNQRHPTGRPGGRQAWKSAFLNRI